MSTNMPTIITDRTYQDAKELRDLANKGYANMSADERTLWNSTHKGRYTANDLNRIGTYGNMLVQMINYASQQGIIDANVTLSSLKVNWQDGDVVTKTELQKLQDLINFIADYTFEDRIDLSNMNYNIANILEYLLEKCDTYVLVYNSSGNLIKQIDFDIATYNSTHTAMSFYTMLTNNLTASEQQQAYKVITKCGFAACGFSILWTSISDLKNIRVLDLSREYADTISMTYYFAQPQYVPIIDTIIMPDRGTNYNVGVFEGTASKRTPISHIIFTNNNQCTLIENRMFYMCRLESIQLPPKLKKIGIYSFYSCNMLKSITLPATMTTIDDYAFAGCNQLTDFRFKGTMAQWSAITKGTDWKQNAAFTQVICTDGVVNV